jgi:hypothetical protein
LVKIGLKAAWIADANILAIERWYDLQW